MSLHAFFEKSKAILVIWLLFELQTPAVHHVVVEFLRHALAEVLQTRLELLILNVLILFILVASWKALPRKTALDKIKDYMTNGLEVITSTLFLSFVRIERSITSRAREVLPVAVRNMLTIRCLVVFGKSEVNNIQGVLGMLLRPN